jgi:hypothetical protein
MDMAKKDAGYKMSSLRQAAVKISKEDSPRRSVDKKIICKDEDSMPFLGSPIQQGFNLFPRGILCL